MRSIIFVSWVSIGHGEKSRALRASAFMEGVAAMPEVIRLRIVEGVRERWLISFAFFVSGQVLLLPLAALATACLKLFKSKSKT